MATFPTTPAPNKFNQAVSKSVQRKTSAAGYTISFAQSTSSVQKFEFQYTNLTESERDILQTFFDVNRGLEFSWIHPSLDYIYTGIFPEDKLSFTWVAPYFWSVKVKIIATSYDHYSYNSPYYLYLDFPTIRDIVSSQDMRVTLDTNRPIDMDSGTMAGTDEPSISSLGVMTGGAYTQLIDYSEDMTQSEWTTIGSPVLTPTTFKATAADDRVIQAHTPANLTPCTVSFIASVESGGQTTGYFVQAGGVTGDNKPITLTETPQLFEHTVVGDGSAMYAGFRDGNTSNWATVTVTEFQLTESNYRLPYVPTVDLPDGTELVTNGDCESVLPTMNGISLTIVDLSAAISSEQSHSATSSLKLTKLNTTSSASFRFADGSNCGLVSGSSYETSIWVYLPSGQTISGIYLYYRNNAGSTTILDSTIIEDTWIQLSGRFVDDDVQRLLYVAGNGDTVAAEYWYADDPSVQKLVMSTGTVPENNASTDRGIKYPIGDALPSLDDAGDWQEVDGINVVPNGNFATDTLWSKGTGTVIEDGQCNINSVASLNMLWQNSVLESGATYEISIEILEYTSGDLRFSLGGVYSDQFSSVGVHTDRITVGGAAIYIQGIDSFVGSIDNISFKQVEPSTAWTTCGDNLLDAFDGAADGVELIVGANWSLNSDWAYSEGVLTSTGAEGRATQEGILTVGGYYEYTFTISNYVSGNVRPIFGDTSGDFVDADGTYTIRNTITSGGDFEFDAGTAFYGSISGISVKQISPASGQIDIVDWEPQFDYSDTSTWLNILSCNDEAGLDSMIFTNIHGSIFIHDNVTTRGIDVNYSANTKYKISAIYGTHPTEGTGKMQIVVTDGTTTWESDVEDFDGSFNPGDHLSLGWENNYYQKIKQILIHKTPIYWGS